MSYFKDRYQGAGAISANARAPRSAPAPSVSGLGAIDYRAYRDTPELALKTTGRVLGRTTVAPGVKVIRMTTVRPQMILSGTKKGPPPAPKRSSRVPSPTPTKRKSSPLSEVEKRLPPRPYGWQIGGPRAAPEFSKGAPRGSSVQIGSGIGTAQVMAMQPPPAAPPSPRDWQDEPGETAPSLDELDPRPEPPSEATPSQIQAIGPEQPATEAMPPELPRTMSAIAVPSAKPPTKFPLLLIGGGALALYLLFGKR